MAKKPVARKRQKAGTIEFRPSDGSKSVIPPPDNVGKPGGPSGTIITWGETGPVQVVNIGDQ